VQTSSGVPAGLGFLVLAILWNTTLFRGIFLARQKRIDEHREWMIRNYVLTFAAVPFRFLPGIFLAFGVKPEDGVAYPSGAWLTVLFSVIFSEWFIGFARKENERTEKALDGGGGDTEMGTVEVKAKQPMGLDSPDGTQSTRSSSDADDVNEI
jgi:hypothetical protein